MGLNLKWVFMLQINPAAESFSYLVRTIKIRFGGGGVPGKKRQLLYLVSLFLSNDMPRPEPEFIKRHPNLMLNDPFSAKSNWHLHLAWSMFISEPRRSWLKVPYNGLNKLIKVWRVICD